MANYGTTTITVSGLEAHRAALRASLKATAYGSLEFSLTKIAPDIWIGDGYVSAAEIKQKGDSLYLYLCMIHDFDCLQLAESLAARYPTLTFSAWFDCEGTWPEFTTAAYAGGREIYYAHFPSEFTASLTPDQSKPLRGEMICFYERTDQRDLAAADVLADRMQLFLDQPACDAGWRSSDTYEGHVVCLLPNTDTSAHVVAVISASAGSATLLHDVDCQGGYRSTEVISFDALRLRYPSLGVRIDELQREESVARERQAAICHIDSHSVDYAEIPF